MECLSKAKIASLSGKKTQSGNLLSSAEHYLIDIMKTIYVILNFLVITLNKVKNTCVLFHPIQTTQHFNIYIQ